MTIVQAEASVRLWFSRIHLNSYCTPCSISVMQRRKRSQTAVVSLTKSEVKRYCDILGVPVTASVPKIKQAFYKKSFVVHPDLNKADQSQRLFTEILQAYEALIAHKRNTYETDHQSFKARRTGRASESTFRPWHYRKFREKSAPPRFHSTSHNDFDEHTLEGSSVAGADLTGVNSAAEWCDQFYQEQLQKDFIANQKAKEDKRESEKLKAQIQQTSNSCIVM